MRFTAVLPVFILYAAALAQSATKLASEPELKSVTVPVTIDHNRVVIDIGLQLPDGSTKHVRGWVDNGNPDLYLSRRVATLMGLAVTCDDKACSAPPPQEITIGGMKISLNAVKQVSIPLKPVDSAATMAPGMAAEINIPSTVLRNYDVLINFPDHEFSIAEPGRLKFNGVQAKLIVNPQNGLVQVPGQIENKKYNLALDVGSSISFLSEEVFDKLSATHPDWPHMTGAIGPANMWGLPDEPKWKLMRVGRVQYGPLFLTDVAVVDFPTDRMTFFQKRAGIATAGLLGSEAMLNYRVGLDYAHSTVYFDIGRLFNFPDFDVVGLILRPEDDGRFTILGIADYDGNPSVPQGQEGVQVGDHLVAVDGIPVPGSTLGQVWSLLGGSPGKERLLTVERAGKQFTVAAKVQHFLSDAPQENQTKQRPAKKK
ncbi:MAG: hypothetical protein WB799_08025 [Candidatus Sulfotelmatobacter sp.]